MFGYIIVPSMYRDIYQSFVEKEDVKLRHLYELNVFPVAKSETLLNLFHLIHL